MEESDRTTCKKDSSHHLPQQQQHRVQRWLCVSLSLHTRVGAANVLYPRTVPSFRFLLPPTSFPPPKLCTASFPLRAFSHRSAAGLGTEILLDI